MSREQGRQWRYLASGVAIFAVAASGVSFAQEDPVADFYRGNTIEMIVGSAPGGGYDVYARLVAQFIGRYIPGNPEIIVHNRPGASGLLAANHVFNLAPQDGSVITHLHNTLTINQLGGSDSVQLDMLQFGWLGSMNTSSTICAVTDAAGVEAPEDVLELPIVVGTSTGSTVLIPTLLNSLAGANFQIAQGYESTTNVTLAMEQGEVDGACGWSWDSARSTAGDYMERGVFSVALDIGNFPEPELDAMDVPFIMDMIPDGDEKDTLALILSTQIYNRPFATTPNVPQERLDALREAFRATMEDEEFIAAAEQALASVVYMPPEDVEAAIRLALDAPDHIKERALEELLAAGWAGL